eukprot:COSAG02_NODE_170_length_31534_cov_33.568498_25_plen_201_part_00
MAVGMDYLAAQKSWPLLIVGYGGRFGPVALAQILFGDISPTGRLPYTIYPEVWANNTAMTDMSLPSSSSSDGRTYKWYRGKVPAPFVFGQGETYTTFTLSVSTATSGRDSRSTNGTTVYTATIVNTGQFAAQQTVMLFAKPVSVPDAPAGPLPVRQLFDFARTPTLAPVQTEFANNRPRLHARALPSNCCPLYAAHCTPS